MIVLHQIEERRLRVVLADTPAFKVKMQARFELERPVRTKNAQVGEIDFDQIGGHRRFVGMNSWPSPCHTNNVVGTTDWAGHPKPTLSLQLIETKGKGWPFTAL